jgi:hypothetical protein
MNPDNIELENLSKSFEYHKLCLEIDELDNITEVKEIAKCYFKLYLKQQEVISSLATTIK